ncbi:MAG: hypothetical protein IKB21_02015, partial [Clostridia bacterium]|nr:hypothetical protein [Clostridia bacterium]
MSETKLHKNAKIKSIIKFVLVAILGFALLGVGIHTVTSYSKTTELGITVMSTDNGTYHNAINGGRVFMNGENVGANSAQTLRVGQTTTLKAQANEGYSFVGFFTDESHNEKLSDKPVYAFAAGEDVSRIYASFAKNYDIEFTIGDPFNDGQTLSFTETLYVGQEVTVSDIIANNENLGEEYAAYYRNSVPEGSSSNDGGFSFSKNTIVVGTQSTAVTIQPTAPTLVGFAGGGGQGTASSPYIINTAQHLINLANGVNAGDPYTGIYFRVDAPITLTNWTPIGGYDSTNSVGRAFEGIFDGNDQLITISSLASANADYASLFGYNAGTIKKVKITGAITGGNYVGAVAGYNTGTITDITSSVDVTATGSYIGGIVGVNGGKVSAAITTTDVTVKGENDTFGLSVGGIVGINLSAGKVYNLVNQGAVTGTNYQWVGGLVGQNHGTIENSFNVGTASGAYYVGGIAGQNGGGTIMNVYNAGDVSSSNTYVGGVTGYNNGGVLKYTYYLKGTAKDAELFQHLGVGQGEVGMPTVNDVEGETIQFVAGQNDTTETRKDLNSTGAYTSNGILSKTLNISGTNTTCLLDALNYGQIYVSKLSTEAVTDYLVWKTDDSFTFPTIHDGSVFETKTSLADYDAASGNGDTPETAYVIKTITHLQTFANEVNGGETYANKYFELGADIDAAVAFRTIGGYDATNSAERYFAGHFDGKGNTISGLTISGGSGSNENTKDYYGLFGYTYTGSTIKNLNVDITISGAENYVGGIVGYNMGTVSNVSFSGTITATGSYIGGIVGVNNGTVNDAINKATINGNNGTFGLSVGGVAGINLSAGHIYNGVNTGTVSGTNYQWVGGITGQNHGKLENSFNSGNVTGAYYVGGIAGQNGGGTINTAYSYGQVTSTNTYGGGVCGYNNGGTIQFTYYQTDKIKAN